MLPSKRHCSRAGCQFEIVFQEGSAAALVARLYETGCRLSSFSVLDIFRQICEAVQYLHEAGYCHRDIKPHNILIEHRNQNGFRHDVDDPQAFMLACIPEVSDEDMDSVDWVQFSFPLKVFDFYVRYQKHRTRQCCRTLEVSDRLRSSLRIDNKALSCRRRSKSCLLCRTVHPSCLMCRRLLLSMKRSTRGRWVAHCEACNDKAVI